MHNIAVIRIEFISGSVKANNNGATLEVGVIDRRIIGPLYSVLRDVDVSTLVVESVLMTLTRKCGGWWFSCSFGRDTCLNPGEDEWLEEGGNCKDDSCPESSWAGDEMILDASSEAGADKESKRTSESSLPEIFPASSIGGGELMLERVYKVDDGSQYYERSGTYEFFVSHTCTGHDKFTHQ